MIGGGLAVYGMLWASGLPVLHDYLHFIGAGMLSAFSSWIQDLIWAVNRPWEIVVIGLCIMVSTHATPSKADMSGSASGLLSVVAVYIGFQFLTSLFPVFADRHIYPFINLDAGAMSLAVLIIQMATFGALASLFLAFLALGITKIRTIFPRKQQFG